jgi:hypothetical protein
MSATHAVHHETVRVKAVYAHLDSMLTGIDRLKKAQFSGFSTAAPLPRHEIEEIVYEGQPSPVRWWTLTGGITGITIAVLLQSLTHSDWPMINPGGKPVVALPPFAIVMFECTVLLGSLFTLLGFFVHAGLPSFFLDKSVQDPRWTDDKFGIVFANANAADAPRIVEILKASGASEVTTGDDTHYEVPNA